MIVRYVALASCDVYSQPVAETIYEQDDRPVNTGLLDHLGRPLYREVRREPVGFRLVKS